MILRTLSLVALLVASASSWADGTPVSYDLTSKGLTYNSAMTEIVFSGDVTLRITGWSDSAPLDVNDGDSTVNRWDGDVTASDLYWWGNSNGLGVVNNDEGSGNVPDHSIDNYASNSTYADRDMVLLEFSEAVVLEGFSVGWQRSYYNQDNVIDAAGIASINQTQHDTLTDTTSPATWDDVLSGSSPIMVSDQINNMTQDTNDDWYSTGTQYYSLNESGSDASTYWLVGFYNEMERCLDVDAFKLLGVTARTAATGSTTEVPEPASIAVFLIGLTMLYRRQQKQLNL